MHTFRKLLYILVYILAIVVILASLLSLLVDTDSRYLKMLDFPRLQFFWAAVLGVILVPLLDRRIRGRDFVVLVGLVAAAGIQGSYLASYTPLSAMRVPDTPTQLIAEKRFSLLIANVKMSNREAEPLVELIQARNPDILLAMETNSWWDEQLSSTEQRYPYKKEVVNDMSYGMILYSRLPLRNVEVHYLQNENVPSFSAVATLSSGQDFVLHTVHPVPPTRFERLPDNEGEREVAMLKVGEAVAKTDLPAVVAGDFNDVAWAATDRLSGSEDLLHDVRAGRGLYNTFDANNFLMRWPLDHVLVTEGWSVAELERLPNIGSDHFPLYVELAWLGKGPLVGQN